MEFEKLQIIQLSDAATLLSKEKGIYFYFDRKTDKIVYIGLAIESGGLKRKIVTQHLNPRYIEYNAEKHFPEDEFQLHHAFLRISQRGILQKGIDKSTFRKSIGRKIQLRPGEETVNYISEYLYLKVVESENIEELKLLKKNLISDYQPFFNSEIK